MVIFKIKLLKILYLLLFTICIKRNHAISQTNQAGFNSFDFKQMKSDIFRYSEFDDLAENYGLENIDQHLKCIKDLNDIRKGLSNSEQWAIKIIDSWGKLPSGFFSGNFYELGEFVQCLNIKRNGTKYQTQYCLGQLVFKMDGFTPFRTSRSKDFNMNEFNIPNVFRTEDSSKIAPRMITAPPQNEATFIFGICLPATCSLHLLEPIIKDKLPKNESKVSVKFLEETCQLEEMPSEFKTIDIVTIMILAMFLCLIVASTCYDVVCTLKNRSKSQALLAFSFYTNGSKLLSCKKTKSPDMMHCLHGVRAISTQWVVLGHTLSMFVLLPNRNMLTFLEFPKRYHNMVILSAYVSVDTFFVLSGLLVSINMLKHLEKTANSAQELSLLTWPSMLNFYSRNGQIFRNIPVIYFHRYLRLTPLLIMSILFSMSLLRYLGSGPLWPQIINLNNFCEEYWWSTLLYVQNYVNPSKICFMHSWYLSVDFQLFLISPVVIYLLYKLRIKLMPVLFLMVLGCIGCTIAIHIQHNLMGVLQGNGKMEKAYFPTHIRYSPWLIGVMAGFVFVEAKKRPFRIPRMFNLFAWILSLAVMLTVIFINYPLMQLDSKVKPLFYGLYDSMSGVGWAIALSYIIFACVHNYGGPVNWFLSYPLWLPLSRLSYSIYLLHFPVIMITMATLKTSAYFSELNYYHAFLGNYVLTVFVSIIATLSFESPIITLEKLIFSPAKKPENNNIQPNEIRNTDTRINT